MGFCFCYCGAGVPHPILSCKETRGPRPAPGVVKAQWRQCGKELGLFSPGVASDYPCNFGPVSEPILEHVWISVLTVFLVSVNLML